MSDNDKQYNLFDAIHKFETGVIEDGSPEMIELFCRLLNSGIINHMQGFYGRTAHNLVRSEDIVLDKGRYIPG